MLVVDVASYTSIANQCSEEALCPPVIFYYVHDITQIMRITMIILPANVAICIDFCIQGHIYDPP